MKDWQHAFGTVWTRGLSEDDIIFWSGWSSSSIEKCRSVSFMVASILTFPSLNKWPFSYLNINFQSIYWSSWYNWKQGQGNRGYLIIILLFQMRMNTFLRKLTDLEDILKDGVMKMSSKLTFFRSWESRSWVPTSTFSLCIQCSQVAANWQDISEDLHCIDCIICIMIRE